MGFETLKVKCTQYGICSQAAFKNARAMLFLKLGGTDSTFRSGSKKSRAGAKISREGCPRPDLTPPIVHGGGLNVYLTLCSRMGSIQIMYSACNRSFRRLTFRGINLDYRKKLTLVWIMYIVITNIVISVLQDDHKLPDDSGEVPKNKLSGGWFDSQLWNLLATWHGNA